MAAQLGLIALSQATDAGMTRGAIPHALHSGEWKTVNHGVYASASVPETWEQAVFAWCLRRPGSAWASHKSAARLFGIAGGAAAPVEISVTKDLRSDGVSVHRLKHLPACDQTTIGPIPVTNIERTLIDLAGVVTDDVLDDAVDDALMTRLTTPPKIAWRLRRLGGRGHRGAATLKWTVDDRMSEGSPIGSRLERRVLSAIVRAGLPKPVLPYPIALPGGKHVRADFAYPAQKLLVEVMVTGGTAVERAGKATSSAAATWPLSAGG